MRQSAFYKSHPYILLGLLLLLFASRLYALQALPLHNDEGLHITRAIEVWHGHPFWDISDGKIINHWLIAAFYPQNTPDFVGRIATLFVMLFGFAVCYGTTCRLFGNGAALFGGLLWIACPVLFFYERTALSDAEAGALAAGAVWLTVHLTAHDSYRVSVGVGIMFALAALFKFTAAPYALSVTLILLTLGTMPLRRRLIHLLIIGAIGLGSFVVPLLYALGHGGFSVALGWIGGKGGIGSTFGINLWRLWEQLTQFGGAGWFVVTLIGLIGVVMLPRGSVRAGVIVLIASLIPLALIVALGSDVMPRHFVVCVPLILTAAGVGLGRLNDALTALPLRRVAQAAVAAVLFVEIAPFAQTAYTDPARLALPPLERHQYISDYSAGYGLREAVLDFPNTIGKPGAALIASMYPDSCRRANFYDIHHYNMICTDAPGLAQIQKLLASNGRVYVLVEKPPAGLDIRTLTVHVTRLKDYPRPDDVPGMASVVLWRLDL